MEKQVAIYRTPLKRLMRIRAVLRARVLDAFLVTSPENRRYLSGFTAEDAAINESSGALFITPAEAVVLTDGRYGAQAGLDCPGWRVFIYQKGLKEAVKRLTDGTKVKRVAYEPEYITCAGLDSLKKTCPQIDFVPLQGRIETMRAVKSPEELGFIKAAISAAEDVFEEISSSIRPGMTEKEIALRIVEGLSRRADGPSFPPIVASGPNGALPHAIPAERPIREGEPIIIDMGARLDGYSSDMTRTIFIGQPRPPFKEIYKMVRKAQIAAQDTIRAGMAANAVDKTARDIINAAGYGQMFNHSLGHGIGLAVHEAPVLSPRAKKTLKPGMVVTIEPGIYLPGQGGVRLENMVYVEERGRLVLSRDEWFYDF
ncbi:MAG: M24 family metallopeptidase [Dissulfurimicrobium sp.]|uniref:M24 family metallopeptidase n=1 Tax=Dissulfurimicrobium TaxID=1769732 RepID=UPI001EDC8D4C|nr:Xaa-Pro peptidase family protein [Dissulfurimicrobium hydrothermale]UKL13869.1 Xaa-Pro peptidase family protein [Dissulfurimicrobium hydrothermale]